MIRAFVEAPAGLAAVSLRLHGGAHCRPPISRMGNKAGYAEVILAALGLRSGEGAGAYVWCEADADVRALLRAYPDAAMLRRIADIIRGWADEEPRALWERLRAERKARGATGDAEDVGGWIQVHARSSRSGAYLPEAYDDSNRTGWPGNGPPTKELSDRCHRLAEYAQIVASNRLIHVAGPELRNTGAGGTTFGGAEFATGAGEVAGRFEAMAGWMFVNANSWKGEGDHWKDPSADVIAAGITVCRSAQGLAADLTRSMRGWPPVAVLPAIPTADDLAAMLGTPGDLEGVVVYADPDYRDTTGYGSTCRDAIPDLARGWSAMGAVVCVSEAVPVPELSDWYSTEITSGRRGQKRTFARVSTEWLTMNRPPESIVATQVSMFG